MSVQEMSNALRHVHNNLDTDRQWLRVRGGLQHMTELERAQVWTALSSHTLTMDAQRAPVVLSQYRTLYKAALRNAEPDGAACSCTCAASTNLNEETLEVLAEYRHFLSSFNVRVTDDTELVLQVTRVIQESDLLQGLKTDFESALKKAILSMAKETNLQQVADKQIQIEEKMDKFLLAEKASESSLAKIAETLATLQKNSEIQTSKLGNSNLGALAEQILLGTRRIESMEGSQTKLTTQIEQLALTLRTHTGEIKTLKSDMGDSHQNIDNMTIIVTKLNESIGNLTEKRKLLADEIKQLGDVFHESTEAIKQRLTNAETSCDATRTAVNQLDEASKSFAKIDELKKLIDELNGEEEETSDAEPMEVKPRDAPATSAKVSGSKLNPYRTNPRPWKGGISNLERQKAKKVETERSNSISPPRRLDPPLDTRPAFRP